MSPSEAEGLFVQGNAGKTPRLRSGPSVLGNVRSHPKTDLVECKSNFTQAFLRQLARQRRVRAQCVWLLRLAIGVSLATNNKS
jgi:hypothetical protein